MEKETIETYKLNGIIKPVGEHFHILSDFAGLSKSALLRAFTKQIGITPYKYRTFLYGILFMIPAAFIFKFNL